jgi:hypothetical protein
VTTVVELRVQSRPQRFTVQLAGTHYNMRLQWNRVTACWVLDLADGNNNPLVNGVALVTGASLLAQFNAYMNIGGQMIVLSDQSHDPSEVPNFTNLGVTGHILFIPDLQ